MGRRFPGTHSRICLFPQVRQWHHEEPVPGGWGSPDTAQPRAVLCPAPSARAAGPVQGGTAGPAAGSSHGTDARYGPSWAGQGAAPAAAAWDLEQPGIMAGLWLQLVGYSVLLPHPCLDFPVLALSLPCTPLTQGPVDSPGPEPRQPPLRQERQGCADSP